jgi:6-phosphogluconolactonase
MAEVIILPDHAAVAREAADLWLVLAARAVAERGAFNVALSGGTTPRPLFELMASEPYATSAPWEHTYVFWADERRVPPGDPASNYGMAAHLLLSHVPVPRTQVFRMDGEDLANAAARAYTTHLERHFALGRGDWPRFDLILLGMGEDGHTASIFPGTRAVSDQSNRVLVYEVPKLHAERMTLTLPVINHARHILFMAVGEAKAEVLRDVLLGDYRPSTYPAQAVKPVDGSLIWLVDEAAALRLPRE